MKRSSVLVVGLLTLTAANVAIRQLANADSAPAALWEFALGTPFPDVQLKSPSDPTGAVVEKLSGDRCEVAVLFNTGCAHCHTAKIVEAGIADSIRLPVTWMTTQTDSTVRAFEALISPTSRVRIVDPIEISSVVVRASPVAFVLGDAREVKIIAPYSGTEDQHAAFREWCDK